MVLIRREVHPREKAIPRDRFFVPRDGNPIPREKFPVPRDGIPVPCGTVNFPVIGTVYIMYKTPAELKPQNLFSIEYGSLKNII